MREARPLDLNYGHLGAPVYDSENREWHFHRVPQIAQQFTPLGKPVIALQPSLGFNNASTQSAAERFKNIRGLAQEYPELLPSSDLLPGLAQISEAVNEITSAHDPTVSELLAFGRANEVGPSHRTKTVPIVAIAGGVAGQLVRLIRLNQKRLSWTGSKNVYLDHLSSKDGEEAQWLGNGSPMQQLAFAEFEGQPSSLLAVRYHGAVSILQPQLRRNEDACMSNHGGTLHSRLDPNHVMTLPIHRSQFTDVAFNPWYHQQLATLDEDGHWTVWNFERLGQESGLWTVAKACEGSIFDGQGGGEEQPSHSPDGWGAVLWAGNTNRLVVVGRRTLAVLDVRDGPSRLSVPNLVPKDSPDWILDIKRSHSATSDVFVTTSTSLCLLRVPTTEEPQGSHVQCLLSWRHFRDPGDISLRLNLLTQPKSSLHEAPVDFIVLYSRLSGVTTVFNIQRPQWTSNRPISSSDPCILPIDKKDTGTKASSGHRHNYTSSTGISALALRVVPFGFYNAGPPSGLGQLYFESNVTFYQLSKLSNDLSLSECLYSVPEVVSELEILTPDTHIRKETVKSRASISRPFIVPDGVDDQGSDDYLEEISPQIPPEHVPPIAPESIGGDRRTIDFEWLDDKLHETGSVVGEAFDEVLEHLHDAVEQMRVAESPHMETLLDLVDTEVSLVDIDKASLEFNDFLQDAGREQVNHEDEREPGEDKQINIAKASTPRMQMALNLEEDPQMSEVYDSLIQTWITSLSDTVPSRVRMAMEKTVRNIAARNHLSNHAISFSSQNADGEGPMETTAFGTGTQFSLPVRRRFSATALTKGKELAATSSSAFASSQISDDVEFLPRSFRGVLPTPEATPSLHSRSSISSLTASEDLASLHLRAYASVAPQPALPTKLLKQLSHWGVVSDPDNYDWEEAQQLFASDDEDQAEERVRLWKRAQKRRKRRREPGEESSSRPQSPRFGGSQPQQLQDSTQGSSQATPAFATASQVEPGRYGGRLGIAKKKKMPSARPAGFK